jgi:DNA modification methylase
LPCSTGLPKKKEMVFMVKKGLPGKYEIDWRSVDQLIPYARNSRTHSKDQVAQIAASIREFGWTNPILVDGDGTIIAGHGRVMAARKLGEKDVPCIELGHLTEAQKRAYVIADNQLALNAGWDAEMLKVEIAELVDADFDLGLLGFDDAMLAGLTGVETEGLTDPDDVPEPPANPVTVLGDVWVMGRHRVVCGDATNPDDWAKLETGEGFVLFTSPPYNAGDASGLRDKYKPGVSKSKKFYDNYSDDLSSNEYADLLRSCMAAALPHVEAMVFNVQPLAGAKRALLKWMNETSSHLVDVITWDKGNAAPHIQPGIMASRFEWIVIMSRLENASRVVPFSSWQGKFSNVYQAPPQRNNEFAKIHGATFPVHLPEFIIGDLMNRSRGVVDCFNGTGTTIIAAEKLGRDGRGIELSPAYVDVAVKRWQDFTGQQAILDGDGRTFDEIAGARLQKAAE